MKKDKEDYQSLFQMLRDFKIDEKEAAKTILSRLRSGRPTSSFKPIIYQDIHDLMNRRKLKKNPQYGFISRVPDFNFFKKCLSLQEGQFPE